jgi:hypothetical protein
MLKLKISGNDYQLPLDWAEVTLEQFDRVRILGDKADAIDLAAALLGIDVVTLKNADLANFHLTIGVNLGWIGRAIPFDKPDVIDYDGKVLNIPKGFDNLTFGQKILFQNTAIDNTVDGIVNPSCYSKLLAIVFAKEVESPYTDKTIEQLTEWFNSYPIANAKPLIDFFLIGLLKSLKESKNILAASPMLMPRQRGLKGLLNIGLTRKSVQ